MLQLARNVAVQMGTEAISSSEERNEEGKEGDDWMIHEMIDD